MHRPGFSNPIPAHSPPLHHPVPQHVSTVPQLRSPPPPALQQQSQQQQQQQQQYNYGYTPQQAPSSYSHPAFGGIINDPTAQMGFQLGKNAFNIGHDYAEQSFNRYVKISALKHYFNVSNSYVVNKLRLVLFPWWHRPWSRQQQLSPDGHNSYFLPPREDINSPDMYIPVMAFVTYILLSTLLAGLRGAFHPELLGLTATTAFAVVIFEILGLKLGCYLLSISNESQLLDLVAYSGYKFVGIIVTLLVEEILGGVSGSRSWTSWAAFFYTFFACAFFLLRSLKYVLLPDSSPDANRNGIQYTYARSQRNRRTQFLFLYSYVVQFIFMWLLTRQDSGSIK